MKTSEISEVKRQVQYLNLNLKERVTPFNLLGIEVLSVP